jgi:hypothetical protein
MSCDKMNILRCSTTSCGYVNVWYFNQYVIQLIIKSNSTKFGLQDLKDTFNITLSHFECQSLSK